MNKLITGILIGAVVTGAACYFYIIYKDQQREDNLAEIVELLKQRQAMEEKAIETINDPNAMLVVNAALSIIVAPTGDYYHFRDNDCKNMKKANLSELNHLLAEVTKNNGNGKLMILIKTAPGSLPANSISLLDILVKAGIKPGQFAEMGISEKEKECLQTSLKK